MGGDFGPCVTVPAALSFVDADPFVSILLVGDISLIEQFLPKTYSSRITLSHASDSVSMSDKPSQVLRHKRQSSLWLAIEFVKDGGAEACVSAGNTGALMAAGRFLLKTFPGVDRPAICKPVPTQGGQKEGDQKGGTSELTHCFVLDLGANINCNAQQLLQFALMGTELASVLDGNAKPRVGLLNIGEEDIKGIETIKLAAELLKGHSRINYIGYVEGDGIYRGVADVLVCDGFIGNIALKSSEGAARLMAKQLELTFKSSVFGRLVGQIVRPLLLKWRNRFDPGRYNGASFLGLQGTLVKSHGSADKAAFEAALAMAKEQALKQLPQKISQSFATLSHS